MNIKVIKEEVIVRPNNNGEFKFPTDVIVDFNKSFIGFDEKGMYMKVFTTKIIQKNN